MAMNRKTFLKLTLAGTASAMALPLLTACGGGEDAATDAADAALLAARRTPTASTTVLTEQELSDLLFMREEEKLAHDVYVTLYDKWGLSVFSNIAQSETQHTEAVLALLVKRGLPDPAEDKPVGVFESQELQELYDNLIARGSEGVIPALEVGALIEETDIYDIREKMAATDEADVLKVYQHLLCGSYSHLQAFAKQLQSRGVSYQAQVISQAEWDAIVAGTSTCTG